jgi:hypothetical protein
MEDFGESVIFKQEAEVGSCNGALGAESDIGAPENVKDIIQRRG